MMYYGSGMGWWGVLLMTVSFVLFWGLVVAAVVAAVRYAGRGGQRGAVQPAKAEQLLAERFARGEIDDEEYRRRLQTLRDVSD